MRAEVVGDPVRVWDCFPINNELDLLELRLAYLDPVVHRFVIVENRYTYTGQAKPFWVAENLERFARWKDKIELVEAWVEPGPHPYVESEQRNRLMQGLGDADPDDVVLLSDVDEIPNKAWIHQYIAQKYEGPMVFEQTLYWYYVNCRMVAKQANSLMCRRFMFHDPWRMRTARCSFHWIKAERDAGWHLSWLGDTPQLLDKMRSLCTEEDDGLPQVLDPEKIEFCRQNALDLFDRPFDWARKEFVPFDDRFPPEFHEWAARHPKYVRSEP